MEVEETVSWDPWLDHREVLWIGEEGYRHVALGS